MWPINMQLHLIKGKMNTLTLQQYMCSVLRIETNTL